jgi:DNA-binding transcriptional ArsR family regulator
MVTAHAVINARTLLGMAVVITTHAASAADLVVGVSPLAELMACLHAIAEPDHHLEVQAWLTRVRAGLSPDLQNQLTSYAPLWARRRCRLLLPFELPLGRTLAEELRRIEDLPLDWFVLITAEAIHGGSVEIGDLLTDDAARNAYIAACERRSFRRGELARHLADSPQALRAGLLSLLRGCADEFFTDEWTRVRHRLEGECADVRARASALAVPEALASLSANATVRQDPPSVVFDKLQPLRADLRGRRCLLVPSIHARPHLIIKVDPGFPIVVHFPIDATADSGRETLAQVRLRLAILSDPGRLALCRHLVNEPITTSELAARTTMTLPQVSRHLARLRETGLLVSRRDGRMIYHRLNLQRLMHLGVDILTAIIR